MKKTAIITGTSSGVGEATACLLFKKNYTVIGLNRRKPKNLIKKYSNDFHWHFLDLKLPDSIPNLCQKALLKYNKIDLFIHCAGEGHFSKLAETSNEKIKNLINVNLTSPIILTKFLLPHIKNGGQIIFVTSITVNMPSPLSSIYAALKAAQEKLVDSLRIELAKQNIKCKILRPGLIKTDFLKKSGIPDEEISNGGQTPRRVAKNLIKLIKKNKTIKNSGLAGPISLISITAPFLLRYLVKKRYLKRLKRLIKKYGHS